MKDVLLIALVTGTLVAADATGTWTGTLTHSDSTSGPARLVLKQEGDKVTGTAGPSATEQHTIENGKAENGNLTFQVATPGGVMKFALKRLSARPPGKIAWLSSIQRTQHTITTTIKRLGAVVKIVEQRRSIASDALSSFRRTF